MVLSIHWCLGALQTIIGVRVGHSLVVLAHYNALEWFKMLLGEDLLQ